MNLLRTITEVINQKNISAQKEMKEAQEMNKRANIVSIGQIQMRSITSNVLSAGTQVARPLTQSRPKNLIEELGIKYLNGLGANFVYPIINNNNSEWASETEQASESVIEFNSIKLQPKRLVSYVEYSNDVILNPSVDLANAIQEDCLQSIIDKVQDTVLNDIVPVIVTNSISTYDDIVNLEYSASEQYISNGVYVVSPSAAMVLKRMKNGDTPVIQNGMINGHVVIDTPSLSGNSIIFGDFTKLLLGQFGSYDITVDNVTLSPKGIVRLIINSYWDWGKLDNSAFVFANAATPTPTPESEPEPEPSGDEPTVQGGE